MPTNPTVPRDPGFPIPPTSDPAVDDQVEHPDEGGWTPIPVSAEAIHTAVSSRLADVAAELVELRKDREGINNKAKTDRAAVEAAIARLRKANAHAIKELITERAELVRLVKAAAPPVKRKRKTPPAT